MTMARMFLPAFDLDGPASILNAVITASTLPLVLLLWASGDIEAWIPVTRTGMTMAMMFVQPSTSKVCTDL